MVCVCQVVRSEADLQDVFGFLKLLRPCISGEKPGHYLCRLNGVAKDGWEVGLRGPRFVYCSEFFALL